jgi:hypothetical protein
MSPEAMGDVRNYPAAGTHYPGGLHYITRTDEPRLSANTATNARVDPKTEHIVVSGSGRLGESNIDPDTGAPRLDPSSPHYAVLRNPNNYSRAAYDAAVAAAWARSNQDAGASVGMTPGVAKPGPAVASATARQPAPARWPQPQPGYPGDFGYSHVGVMPTTQAPQPPVASLPKPQPQPKPQPPVASLPKPQPQPRNVGVMPTTQVFGKTGNLIDDLIGRIKLAAPQGFTTGNTRYVTPAWRQPIRTRQPAPQPQPTTQQPYLDVDSYLEKLRGTNFKDMNWANPKTLQEVSPPLSAAAPAAPAAQSAPQPQSALQQPNYQQLMQQMAANAPPNIAMLRASGMQPGQIRQYQQQWARRQMQQDPSMKAHQDWLKQQQSPEGVAAWRDKMKVWQKQNPAPTAVQPGGGNVGASYDPAAARAAYQSGGMDAYWAYKRKFQNQQQQVASNTPGSSYNPKGTSQPSTPGQSALKTPQPQVVGEAKQQPQSQPGADKPSNVFTGPKTGQQSTWVGKDKTTFEGYPSDTKPAPAPTVPTGQGPTPRPPATPKPAPGVGPSGPEQKGEPKINTSAPAPKEPKESGKTPYS